MGIACADDATRLVPFKLMNLEQAIELIAEDKLVEATPKSTRLRKKNSPGRSPPAPQRRPRRLAYFQFKC